MDLRNLPDTILLDTTKNLAAKERAITTQLLHYLREVERRRLFATFYCSSLLEYCVKVLKMSDSQAWRRVNSSRALADNPSIESKLLSGDLSLTATARAQVFFKREERHTGQPVSNKEEILQKLEGKSTREVEKILVAEADEPMVHRQERLRTVGKDFTELRITVSRETLEDLERMKEIWSHSVREGGFAAVVSKMAALCREQQDPVRKAARALECKMKRSAEKESNLSEKIVAEDSGHEQQRGAASAPTLRSSAASTDLATRENKKAAKSRYIPAAVKHAVWERDAGQCTYVDPASGKKCSSTHHLQLDHIKPFALGGAHTLENLRLCCFAHNQWNAINIYGASKMQQYGSRRN